MREKSSPLRLPVADRLVLVEHVGLADHFIEGAEAHFGHQFTHFLRDEEEVVDHVLGLAGELAAQFRVLGRNADRAGVQVALAHHDAAGGDQGRGREAHLVGAEQGGHDNVAPGADASVGLDRDAAAQVVEHQGLLGFGKADLPGAAGMLDRGEGACARAAFETGDMVTWSARALATPAATVPTPISETSFTEISACEFAFFRS